MLRECDNDSCDYDTYVNGDGVPRARWVHVPECVGPVEYEIPNPGQVSSNSFLATFMKSAEAERS